MEFFIEEKSTAVYVGLVKKPRIPKVWKLVVGLIGVEKPGSEDLSNYIIGRDYSRQFFPSGFPF